MQPGGRLMDDKSLTELALKAGFHHTARLRTKTMRFLPEIREMCKANRCGCYGKSWVCPPACGSLEELETRIRRYRDGILVQYVGKVEDPFDLPSMKAAERLHKSCFEKLAVLLREQYPDLLALGAGTCTVCPECSYPAFPCRCPDRAFVSMEAAGLWVSEVCERSGLSYHYGDGSIAYTGCFLIE